MESNLQGQTYVASTLFFIRKYHRIELFQKCIDKWRYSFNRRQKDETCNKVFMLIVLKLCVDINNYELNW